jgi:hypothetical protein
MRKLTQATVFALTTAATSVALAQTAPELIDSTGRSLGRYAGDSVLVLYGGQVVRIFTDAHWDYSTGRPASSGLTWKYVPIYYTSLDCTGQSYIGASLFAQTPQGATTPPAVTPYTSPAYGSHFLLAPFRIGNTWTAYISAENPTFQQVAIQSELQYGGSCAQKSYPTLWVTPVITQVGLDIYGVPPFYVR